MNTATLAAPAPAPAVAAPVNIDAIVVKYLALREKKAALKKQFTADTEAVDALMDRAERFFLGYMQQHGLTSLPTQAGTPYRAERVSVTVADKMQFKAWLFENTERFDQYTDLKANKTAVVAFKEEFADLPPGLNYSSEYIVNVRKS